MHKILRSAASTILVLLFGFLIARAGWNLPTSRTSNTSSPILPDGNGQIKSGNLIISEISVLGSTSTGLVGIGGDANDINSVPKEKLDVKGNVAISGQIIPDGVSGAPGQVLHFKYDFPNTTSRIEWGANYVWLTMTSDVKNNNTNGDGVCNGTENCANAPFECQLPSNAACDPSTGKGTYSQCGNGICESGESQIDDNNGPGCPADCKPVDDYEEYWLSVPYVPTPPMISRDGCFYPGGVWAKNHPQPPAVPPNSPIPQDPGKCYPPGHTPGGQYGGANTCYVVRYCDANCDWKSGLVWNYDTVPPDLGEPGSTTSGGSTTGGSTTGGSTNGGGSTNFPTNPPGIITCGSLNPPPDPNEEGAAYCNQGICQLGQECGMDNGECHCFGGPGSQSEYKSPLASVIEIIKKAMAQTSSSTGKGGPTNNSGSLGNSNNNSSGSSNSSNNNGTKKSDCSETVLPMNCEGGKGWDEYSIECTNGVWVRTCWKAM